MQIIYKKPSELNPYKNNPRFNDEAVAMVKESIQRFGFNVPITIDKHGVIVTGHTRHKAALQLGLAEVPCIVLENLNDDQVKAFRLVDNRTSEMAKWDFQALAIELEGITMDMTPFSFELPEADPELDEDDYDVNPPNVPISKRGQIYQLGRHRLMCGDSCNPDDIAALVGDQAVDIFITDPPYNVDLGEINRIKVGFAPERYKGANTNDIINDKMGDEAFEIFLTAAFQAANSVLKPGGVFYIWHGAVNSFEFQLAMKNVGWHHRQILIWNKSSLCLGLSDYQWKHEPVFYGWKDGAGHYFINDRGFTSVFEDKKIDLAKIKLAEAKALIKELMRPEIPVTVINEDKPLRNDEHPTMKPVKLIGRLIANSSRKGELVLDSFGGSGTTIVAAEKLGRTCLMMEIDPKYCDVIIDRYEKLTGQKAERIPGGTTNAIIQHGASEPVPPGQIR